MVCICTLIDAKIILLQDCILRYEARKLYGLDLIAERNV